MGPKRKRVLVTPSDEVWELIEEVHRLTGTAKAAIVAEILDQVAPVFAGQIEALRYIHEGRFREAQQLVQNKTNEAIGKAAQSSLDLDAAIDKRTVRGKRGRRDGTP